MNHRNASRTPAAAPPASTPSIDALVSVIRTRRDAVASELSETRARLARAQDELVELERAQLAAPPVRVADLAERAAVAAREVQHLERVAYTAVRVVGELERLIEASRALGMTPTTQAGLFDAPAPRPAARRPRPCVSCCGTGKDGAAPCPRCWGTKVAR